VTTVFPISDHNIGHSNNFIKRVYFDM
jgi:hypothetical protein